MAEYKAGPRQRSPTHPGRILDSALRESGLNAAKAAPLIGTSKVTLGRIINEEAPVSTEMALRLGKFFGNGAELWAGLQTDYDLWHTATKIQPEIAKIKTLDK
ncbi:MAG: HigA family addiction module antitoxin [bacterium]|nr:HigA family addiction module antitoxin [bacterium]